MKKKSSSSKVWRTTVYGDADVYCRFVSELKKRRMSLGKWYREAMKAQLDKWVS